MGRTIRTTKPKGAQVKSTTKIQESDWDQDKLRRMCPWLCEKIPQQKEVQP